MTTALGQRKLKWNRAQHNRIVSWINGYSSARDLQELMAIVNRHGPKRNLIAIENKIRKLRAALKEIVLGEFLGSKIPGQESEPAYWFEDDPVAAKRESQWRQLPESYITYARTTGTYYGKNLDSEP